MGGVKKRVSGVKKGWVWREEMSGWYEEKVGGVRKEVGGMRRGWVV